MTATLIATTPRHQMHALAFQGIKVTDCHRQLCDILQHKLGAAYARLLAEPSVNTADNSVDWYTPLQGTVQPLSALAEAQQNALRQKLAGMAQEMQAVALQLQESTRHTEVTSGHILALALQYPDDNCLYAVGDDPVITCWGFGPGTPGAAPQDLSRLSRQASPPAAAPAPTPAPAPAPTPAPAAVPAPAPQPTAPPEPLVVTTATGCLPRFLFWLLPLALLILLLWFLFTAFGPWHALGGKDLFHMPALPEFHAPLKAELVELDKNNAALEKEILDLRSKVREHIAQCPRKPAAPVAEPKEELIIPEDKKNLDFMAGRWRCETDLVNSTSQKPIIVEFTFDKNGNGTGRVYEGARVCEGKAKARRVEEGLHIVLEEQVCPGGQDHYSSQDIICRQGKGAARCYGRNAGGEPWDARFLRYAR